jgi:ABC-2 type transport system permease protein
LSFVPPTKTKPLATAGVETSAPVFGLALSSVARSAESASPLANATYLPVAIMSGIFDPTFSVPRWLSAVIGLLPVRALAQILQQGYPPVEHAPASDLLVLEGWAVGGCLLAVWRFRWQ